MAFNKQKFFIALVCTLVGWGVGYEMGKKKAEDEFAKQLQQPGISHFFGIPIPNPFGVPEKDKTPPSFLERFFGMTNKDPIDQEHPEENEDSFFGNPLSFFGHQGIQPKVDTHEDENNVYMEIDLESFDKNSLSARVEDGRVVIEGNQKTEGQGSSMSSHFYQSFSAPAGTDPSKVDMSHENNKLVLKFPKLKR